MMPGKIRILHIIESITIGGAEKLLCNTIRELPEYEHLVVTVFGNNDLSLLPGNTQHISLNAKSKVDVFFKGKAYRKILEEFKPDLVHAHLYFAVVLAKAFTPKNIPLVFTQHFEFSKAITRWYYSAVDAFFSNPRQHCIAVSKRVLDDYIATTSFKGKTYIIENYIPENYFLNTVGEKKDKEELKLISLGNVKPIKNQRFILNAFENLRDLNVSCDIYGDGEEKNILEALAREKNIRVYFKGVIDEPSSVLDSYDLFIMPSLTEGFPLALFEAMAKKLPVLVSDIPAFHEVLNGAGNYLKLGDPGGVREIVLKYLNDPSLLKTDGEKMKMIAREKADKKVYLRKLRSVYQKALATE